MKKYLTSEPVNSTKNSEKQKSASVPTDNSSPTTSLIPELTTEPSHLQSPISTSQENIEIFEPDVSDNDSTQDANILTENDANTNDYQIVCEFCNREHKKLRSKILPLHKADTNQFKSTVLPNIEDQEYTDLLNQLKKFSGPKISYHTECRVNFNNINILLKRKPSSKSDWHCHREYHQLAFNEISGIIEEDVFKKGRAVIY
ncbi:hypothetical protein TNIN_422041 [Trichonephila inaurata madagascariensis]|uniref:Uncharacterized protein n=1 Tax=Trichonephila inaurata madagascariensis TaxID=2747483 RepID=A0A8X6YZ86_9ARAC|nr:hypothetical protein TNIN_422041 [Trichonephila inaurata madagascariensis]